MLRGAFHAEDEAHEDVPCWELHKGRRCEDDIATLKNSLSCESGSRQNAVTKDTWSMPALLTQVHIRYQRIPGSVATACS